MSVTEETSVFCDNIDIDMELMGNEIHFYFHSYSCLDSNLMTTFLLQFCVCFLFKVLGILGMKGNRISK